MTTKSLLEHTLDPSNYQHSVNGQIFKLTDLSREDLLQVVCEHMETMESIDILAQRLSEKVREWRD